MVARMHQLSQERMHKKAAMIFEAFLKDCKAFAESQGLALHKLPRAWKPTTMLFELYMRSIHL